MTTLTDKLNRELEPGQAVVWATGWSRGPKIGIVKKLCKQRVRITYKYQFTSTVTKETKWYTTDLLQRPERLIIVGEDLPQAVTMELLKHG